MSASTPGSLVYWKQPGKKSVYVEPTGITEEQLAYLLERGIELGIPSVVLTSTDELRAAIEDGFDEEAFNVLFKSEIGRGFLIGYVMGLEHGALDD